MWKIILDLCQEEKNIISGKNYDIFDPAHYMDKTVLDYVCFSFPNDVQYSIILPSCSSKFRTVKRKIVERMIKLSKKPSRWFFDGSKIELGKNYYSYKTTDVTEDDSVSNLDEDCFYIECMDCIGIDENEWVKAEICKDCIFNPKCIKVKE